MVRHAATGGPAGLTQRQWSDFPEPSVPAEACDYRLEEELIMPYTPEQNGIIERFFRSLKEECV